MRHDDSDSFIRDHPADRGVTNSKMAGKFLEGQKFGSHQIKASPEEVRGGISLEMEIMERLGPNRPIPAHH